MPDIYTKRTNQPYLAESPADMSEKLWRAAEPLIPPDDPIKTIFVMPTQLLHKKLGSVSGARQVPEQALIFTTNGVLHVQGEGQAVYMRGDSLLYVHLSLIMLYGRLELCGAVNGNLTRAVMEYNAVNHRLLTPALQHLFELACGPSNPNEAKDDLTEKLLEKLGQQSLKFRNGLREYTLQPGERLLGLVFQPCVEQIYLGILRRRVVPIAVLALTDRNFLILEEGLSNATSYGWFITFCPRACVAGFDFKPNMMWQDMSIRLTRNNLTAERQVKVEEKAVRDWQALWEKR